MIRRQTRLRSLITLPGLLLATKVGAQPPAGANDPEHNAQGVIVSIRGDVLQIRPENSPRLERVLVDAQTLFTTMQMTGLDSLKPGTKVGGMGELNGKGGVKVQMLMVAGEGSGMPFGGGGRGIQSMGVGNTAMVNGKVKTIKPFVLVDDDGNTIPVSFGDFTPVMGTVKVGRDRLLVGTMITADGERTVDRLLHARTINVMGGFGPGGPGGPGGGPPGMGGGGALFGKVISLQNRQLKLQPRFAEQPASVTTTPATQIQRQIVLDPETIKPGDQITCQGKRTGGTYEEPTEMVVAIVLPGKQRYPRVSGGGMMAMMRGGNAPSMTLTGRVVSLLPFVVKRDDGREITAIVPGQTPYVDLRPATLSDLRPDEKIVVITAPSGAGGMTATRIVIGASPITGFGG